MADRTAPYEQIRNKPLSKLSDATGRLITRTVTIPGLKDHDGKPITVDTTLDIQEIDTDWISGIVDFDYSTEPQVFGNHPHAVGPLRHWLPDAYPLPAFPASRRDAQHYVTRMLVHRDLGGWVTLPTDSNTLEIRPPRFNQISGFGTDEYRRQAWFSTIREYLPFQADIWWDDAHDVGRIRPTRKDADDRPTP